MKGSSYQLTQEYVQGKFSEKNHAFQVGISYGFPILIHSLLLAFFGFLFSQKAGEIPSPFLFYIIALATGEILMNRIFKEDVIRISTSDISSENIKITWPMNSITYWSFFWVALDILIDYLVIQWALKSTLPYNLIFPIFFGSKAIGIAFQAFCCLFKSVDSILFISFLIICLAAFWAVVMLELEPVPQIVLAVILTKGLLGNFLALGKIKLAQNSEIKIV